MTETPSVLIAAAKAVQDAAATARANLPSLSADWAAVDAEVARIQALMHPSSGEPADA